MLGSTQPRSVPAHHQRRSCAAQCSAVPAPPLVGAPQTLPLSKELMVEHLRGGCKPRERWRYVAKRGKCNQPDVTPSIGTEHEKFGFRRADKRPMDYSEVKTLLQGLVQRCGTEVPPDASSLPRSRSASVGGPSSRVASSSAPSLTGSL